MLNFLPGRKTYALAGAFILWAAVGILAYWADPTSAIAIEPDAALRIAGEGLMVIFLRKGVASA